MPELAEIFRRHQEQYLRQFGGRMLPSHRRVMSDIMACRTSALGGSVYRCASCGRQKYSYHSCGNRHCPKCGHRAAVEWAQNLSARIPAIPCFLLTFTLPHGPLGSCIRSHQKALYGLLFQASSQALKKLCADPRFLGASPGMLGVLHTWQRDLGYHPHLHYLVPAGGINADGKWVPSRSPKFLVPVQALSPIFRAKFRDGLHNLGLLRALPSSLWTADWVVHCQPAGRGPELINYLARYLFKVAIANRNILSLHDEQVTFRYQPVGSQSWKQMTLPATAFMARFLQHVLPRGFTKVRYYGFLHPRCRPKLCALGDELQIPPSAPVPQLRLQPAVVRCPDCRTPMTLIGRIHPLRGPPP
jgi:hypothetical protein